MRPVEWKRDAVASATAPKPAPQPAVSAAVSPAVPGATPSAAPAAIAAPVSAGGQPTTESPASAGTAASYWWLPVPALLTAAWWVVWYRGRQLAGEAARLARQQRVLKSAHTRLQDESERLRQQAINDPLTGTLNRQAFATGLHELADHLAHYGRPINLIMIDLDHFKAINDRLGHIAGDSALKLVAGIVREHLVSADLFGRFGGDEFLIACADQTPKSAQALAETIRAAVQAAAADHVPPLPGLTLSIGLAQADTGSGYSAKALFARADAALYEAKRNGRNRVVVADASMPMPAAGTGTGSIRHL